MTGKALTGQRGVPVSQKTSVTSVDPSAARNQTPSTEGVVPRAYAPSRLENLPLPYVVSALFCLGLLSRTILAILLKVPVEVHFHEVENIARNLAQYGTFANPFIIPTGLSAHCAPGYPMLLSLIFRSFGYGAAAGIAMAAMNFGFASLQYALLPVLADVARIPRLVGIVAGVVGALLPNRIFREVHDDTALSALVIVALTIITMSWVRARPTSGFYTFLVGLAWGVGMLCSANLLLVFAFLLLFFAISSWRRKEQRWKSSIGFAVLGMMVAIAPWTARNYRALGGLIFIRSNFGLELRTSNHPGAYVLLLDNLDKGGPKSYFNQHHPYESVAAAQLVREEGEIKYNRQELRQAIQWIQANPREFARLTFYRTLYFWFPPSPHRIEKYSLFLWVFFGVLGFYVVWREHRELGLVLLAVWAGYPTIHYVIQADNRYRYPIDWTFTFLAVYFLFKLWELRSSRRSENAAAVKPAQ